MRTALTCAAVGLSMLAMSCPAAFAANVTVQATTSNAFDPPTVTITQGDTVTWSNVGSPPSYHNVHFDDGLFVMPMSPMNTNWTVFRSFNEPGSYSYYCEVHKVDGMTGTVVVNAAPPGGGGGGGPGPPPPPVDTAPVSSLVGPAKQRVGKLFVRASMNEAGTLTATGTVSVPGGAAKLYRFKRASAQVGANQSVKLRLKLTRKALRAVKRALRHGKKLRAKVAVTATDTTGHETIRKQTVRLKR